MRSPATPQRWPSLTVVLIVRNGLPELREQIEALRRQRYPGEWDLVCVDDGSTDGSRAVLAAAVANLSGCVVDGPSAGMGAARRAGVRAARGEALIFVDHDDAVAPGYLTAMGAALSENEIVAARMEFEELNPPWVRASRPPQQTDDLSVDHWRFGSGASLGIRRNAYDELGGHDPRVNGPDDRDLCFRATRAGYAIAFVPDAVLHYRYRCTNRAILQQARRGARGDAWLYRRHRTCGYPARSAKAELVKLWQATAMLLRGIVWRDRAAKAGGVHRLGRVLGHVEGCFTERVAYLRWNLPTMS